MGDREAPARRDTIADVVSRYVATEHDQVKIGHILDILDEVSRKLAPTGDMLVSAKQRQDVESFIERDPTLPMEQSKVIDFVEQMLTTSSDLPAWSDASSIMQMDRSERVNFLSGSSRSPLAQSTPTQSATSRGRAARVTGRFGDRRSPSFHRSLTEPRLHSLAERNNETERPGTGPNNVADGSTGLTAADTTSVQKLQADRIRVLEEHERGLRDTILDNEVRLQDLQERFETQGMALKSRDRELQESRAAELRSKQHIRDLEQDLEASAKDAAATRQQHLETRTELDVQRREMKQLDAVLSGVHDEVSVLEAKLRQGEVRLEHVEEEKAGLAARLSDLRAEDEKHEHTKARLHDAEEACKQWESQVQRLQRDMEELKAFSLPRPSINARGSQPSAGGAEDVKLPMSDSTASTDAMQRLAVDTHVESYKKLGRDIQLQRTLIDKLIELNSKNRQAKPSNVSGASAIRVSREVTQADSAETRGAGLTRRQSSSFIILYSIIVLTLGYVLAQHLVPLGKPIYGEYRAWQRANDLAPIFTPYGIGATGLATRWWEGGPRIIEQAGFWLEQRLLDSPWPS